MKSKPLNLKYFYYIYSSIYKEHLSHTKDVPYLLISYSNTNGSLYNHRPNNEQL